MNPRRDALAQGTNLLETETHEAMKPKKPIFDAEGYQTNLTDLNGTPLPDLSKVKARSFVRNPPRKSPRAASSIRK